jgi:4-aminobutyrate aminotransferase/(S)-3-amino-2-methylpropionate transaminase
MFACEREDVRPDILCVGKALGGGFPISAAIASKDVASAWAPSEGEALHTSTYLGNPMGCAAALANLEEIDRLKILLRVREREPVMAEKLHTLRRANPILADVRGRGMLWGLEFKDPAVANRCVLLALARGLLLLQSGPRGETITLAPPPVISDVQLNRGFEILGDVLGALF